MFCNECSVEPALVDHLDLSRGEARLRSLCGPCAQAELQRWNQERLGRPQALPAPDDKDRRAA
jgi:protein-arginine kinase activator protein McsA